MNSVLLSKFARKCRSIVPLLTEKARIKKEFIEFHHKKFDVGLFEFKQVKCFGLYGVKTAVYSTNNSYKTCKSIGNVNYAS